MAGGARNHCNVVLTSSIYTEATSAPRTRHSWGQRASIDALHVSPVATTAPLCNQESLEGCSPSDYRGTLGLGEVWLSGGQALINHAEKVCVLQRGSDPLLVIQLLVHLILRCMTTFSDLQHITLSAHCFGARNKDATCAAGEVWDDTPRCPACTFLEASSSAGCVCRVL